MHGEGTECTEKRRNSRRRDGIHGEGTGPRTVPYTNSQELRVNQVHPPLYGIGLWLQILSEDLADVA